MRQLIVCGLLLAGCVSNTGAVPLGNGEYMITVENDFMTGGVGGAQRRGVEAAQVQCGSRPMKPGDVSIKPQVPYQASAFTMRFSCG
jgi:hypothetical protein